MLQLYSVTYLAYWLQSALVYISRYRCACYMVTTLYSLVITITPLFCRRRRDVYHTHVIRMHQAVHINRVIGTGEYYPMHSRSTGIVSIVGIIYDNLCYWYYLAQLFPLLKQNFDAIMDSRLVMHQLDSETWHWSRRWLSACSMYVHYLVRLSARTEGEC